MSYTLFTKKLSKRWHQKLGHLCFWERHRTDKAPRFVIVLWLYVIPHDLRRRSALFLIFFSEKMIQRFLLHSKLICLELFCSEVLP